MRIDLSEICFTDAHYCRKRATAAATNNVNCVVKRVAEPTVVLQSNRFALPVTSQPQSGCSSSAHFKLLLHSISTASEQHDAGKPSQEPAVICTPDVIDAAPPTQILLVTAPNELHVQVAV